MRIELLVIPNCPNDDTAAELIRTTVADARVRAEITRTVIATEREAQQRGFTGSPTILLDGTDPFGSPDAPVALSCRLYSTPEGPRGVPAPRDLRRALERAADERRREAPEPRL